MESGEHASGDQPPEGQGKITPADIERARRQIDVPKFSYNKPITRAPRPIRSVTLRGLAG